MKIVPSLILASALAACAPQQPVAGESASPPPPASEAASVATLKGEWRVAGIDGRPVDQPVGLALSASEQEIWWNPRCAGYVRSYRIDGTSFTTGPYLGFVEPKPGEARPVCAIAPPPRMDEVFRALTAARTIRRTPQNGIEIAGGGHSLLLFSQ